MNKKGFSLMELLGTITILGILMLVAVPAVYKYLVSSKEQAYATLLKTSYEAAHSMAIAEKVDLDYDSNFTPTQLTDENCSDPAYCVVYSISDLYENGYMDRPADPNKSSDDCDGYVYITRGSGSDNALPTYKYTVKLECPAHPDPIEKVWTTDGENE